MSRICGVVSAYAPDWHVADRVLALSRVIDHVVVVDDTGSTTSDLTHLAGPGITVVGNTINVGIAAALNTGIRVAIANGATHVLTLDQDSTADAEFVNTLFKHIRLPRIREVGALVASPAFVGGQRNGRPHAWSGGECTVGAIQSGLLFDVMAFQQFGWFREEFFIDAVEFDFLFRLHRANRHITVCPGIELQHVVGDPRRGKHLPIASSNHAAFRRYYMWRNHLTLARENWKYDQTTCTERLKWLTVDTVKALILEDAKVEKARAVLEGIWDFARGDLGPRPSARRRG